MDAGALSQMIAEQRRAYADVNTSMRVRRSLVSRVVNPADASRVGVYIPAPFNQTSLAIRTMIGEPAKAVQHYASRIAANRPEIECVPFTIKDTVSVTLDKRAGEQERLDAQLWDECNGRQIQWEAGWSMSVGGVAYILTMPRDADFGLPARDYYDATDEQVALLRSEGKIGPLQERAGKLVYAEHGDVWAGRRKNAAKQRAVDGRSLFTMKVYSRDLCVRENDRDGMKWWAGVEEIPFSRCGAGSDVGVAWAKTHGKKMDDWSMYGLFLDENRKVIGGIANGVPMGTTMRKADSFTLIRYFDREEYVIMVAAAGTVEGATEIYRGKHGCRIGGVPAVPVEEIAFYRTDSDIPGCEFSTALEQIFALVPLINQIETLRSNAGAFNLIPRWVVELKDGTVLRGLDGEPKIVNAEQVPGLNPQEAASYPGTLKQLTISTSDTDELLKVYLEQLANAMPAPVTAGVSGSSAPAWQVQQLIQQSQETLRQPVDNFARSVQRIIQRWHGWMRQLDTPVYLFAAPGSRKGARTVRGLIEFDPKDLTDAINVTQQLDTPSERSVLVEQGRSLLAQCLITYEDFFRDYMKVQDARQAVIDMYAQQGVNATMPSLIQTAAAAVQGEITYELLNTSPNFALASARQMAAQAQQPAVGPDGQPVQPEGGQVPGGEPMAVPGAGMAPTLDQQSGRPPAPMMPVTA